MSEEIKGSALKIGDKFVQFCPICNKIVKAKNYWRSITALKLHLKRKHGKVPDYIIIKCPICGEKFLGKFEEATRKCQLHMLSHFIN